MSASLSISAGAATETPKLAVTVTVSSFHMTGILGGELAAQRCRRRALHALERRLGEEDEEFLAAVAALQIAPAQDVAHLLTDGREHRVAAEMPRIDR